MTYTFTTVDGQRVERNVAAAFAVLEKAFQKEWNLTLHVTSGTRTKEEQDHLYDLYREGKGNLAVPSPYSHHEEDGPVGPRALDVHDSGTDAGVTVYGTPRAVWLRQNAEKFHFNPAGYGFHPEEPWHIEYSGSFSVAPKPSSPAGHASAKNPFGISYCAGLQKIANLYGGGTSIDQQWGPKSAKGFSQFLRTNYGYSGNDVLGPVMWAAIARWLRKRWGYRGNDVPGPVMRAALQRAETANYKQLK